MVANARCRAEVCSRAGPASSGCSPNDYRPRQRSLRGAEMRSGTGSRPDRPQSLRRRADRGAHQSLVRRNRHHFGGGSGGRAVNQPTNSHLMGGNAPRSSPPEIFMNPEATTSVGVPSHT